MDELAALIPFLFYIFLAKKFLFILRMSDSRYIIKTQTSLLQSMSAETEYQRLVELISQTHAGESSQMFGKKCIKVNGKAVIVLFKECLVFKLPQPSLKKALSLSESVLWDPSGKDRPMKEWVQVCLKHKEKFKELASAAANGMS